MFLLGYGLLVVLSTAIWVPGGLLVPMMILGAAIGRICGLSLDLIVTSLAKSERRTPIPWIPEMKPLLQLIHGDMTDPIPGFPPEPGVLAIAGCAGFLSGSGALALFVIVLLVEITLDPTLVMVIVIAVIAARGTASLLGSKGLYHSLINVQSLPFLDEEHYWRAGNFTVGDLLVQDERNAAQVDARDVVSTILEDASIRVGGMSVETRPADAPTGDPRPEADTPPRYVDSWPPTEEARGSTLIKVRRFSSTEEIRSALNACLASDDQPMVNGFPVVEAEGQLCGLVTREALQLLLNEHDRRREGGDAAVEVTHSGARAAPLMLPGGAVQARVFSAPTHEIDLGQVMDAAPFVVQTCTPVRHAHMLFSRCGLRHLVVVDTGHRPLGVITRKSLMPWRTPWPLLGEATVSHDTFLVTRMEHSPTATPPSSPLVQPLR